VTQPAGRAVRSVSTAAVSYALGERDMPSLTSAAGPSTKLTKRVHEFAELMGEGLTIREIRRRASSRRPALKWGGGRGRVRRR
jgi:hypothetical protein